MLKLATAAGGGDQAWSTSEDPHQGVDRLADAARRLGTAQAAWAGRPLPHPWLSRRWLRQYVASKPVAEPVPWDHHPRAAAVWPAGVRAGLRALWERRGELLDLAEALPQTTSTWTCGR